VIHTDGRPTIAHRAADAALARPKVTGQLIDVDERTIKLGLFCGLMRIAEDGVVELTEKGESYLASWLHERPKVDPAATAACDGYPALAGIEAIVRERDEGKAELRFGGCCGDPGDCGQCGK
jgi:hypothetical protein